MARFMRLKVINTLLDIGLVPLFYNGDVETSIEFKDGQMSGSVGCNHFGGKYVAKSDVIEFGLIMTTEMFCENVAEQESITLATLQGETGFVLDGNTLTITSKDGNSSIVLERK